MQVQCIQSGTRSAGQRVSRHVAQHVNAESCTHSLLRYTVEMQFWFHPAFCATCTFIARSSHFAPKRCQDLVCVHSTQQRLSEVCCRAVGRFYCSFVSHQGHKGFFALVRFTCTAQQQTDVAQHAHSRGHDHYTRSGRELFVTGPAVRIAPCHRELHYYAGDT